MLGNTSWTEAVIEGGYPSNTALAAGGEEVTLHGGSLNLVYEPIAW